MKNITLCFLQVLFVTLLGADSFALPKIDKKLLPFVNTESNQTVTVIALFHDKSLLSRLDHSPRSHRQMEQELMANARLSQTSVMKRLMQGAESGPTIAAKTLWLFNGALFRIPASKLKALAQNEDISALIADHPIHLLSTSLRTSATDPAQYASGLQAIHIPELRQKYPNLDGTGVRVGILDSGIDATHPDLENKVMSFKDFINSKPAPYDTDGHGTHVAGTLAGGNASGTAIGVAPGVKLVVGRAVDDFSSMATLLESMQWIADPDGNPQTDDFPQVVNNSWGGSFVDSTKDPMDEPFCKAVAGWVKLGILPIFAAGNSGPGESTLNLPAGCPQAVAVGAAGALYSSRGPAVWKSGSVIKPTISAPGTDIFSSLPNGKYGFDMGTSMATPHVAGVAALLIQAVPNISLEKIQELLVKSAVPITENTTATTYPNNDYGAGELDALKTIENASILVHGGQIVRAH